MAERFDVFDPGERHAPFSECRFVARAAAWRYDRTELDELGQQCRRNL